MQDHLLFILAFSIGIRIIQARSRYDSSVQLEVDVFGLFTKAPMTLIWILTLHVVLEALATKRHEGLKMKASYLTY